MKTRTTFTKQYPTQGDLAREQVRRSGVPYFTVKTVEVMALLDTGATIKVLPFSLGTELGFEWDRQTTVIQLGGNLSAAEARAVAVSAVVGDLPAVRLGFAWTRSDRVPVIWGHMNFFLEFDGCFFRSLQRFEIRPTQRPRNP